jgi:catechol 2,3-dioxygenase-like lactoylglutathione lyase family enzyme
MKPDQTKPHITHIALKVEDIDKAAAFYKDVFGFEEVARHRDGDHESLHLTDGRLDLAMVKYDAEDSFMGNQADAGPCIHHFGIDVDDIAAFKARIEARGGTTFADPTNPGEKVIKFRVPGAGGIAEIAPHGWHSRKTSKG